MLGDVGEPHVASRTKKAAVGSTDDRDLSPVFPPGFGRVLGLISGPKLPVFCSVIFMANFSGGTFPRAEWGLLRL